MIDVNEIPFFRVICSKDLFPYIVQFQKGRKWHTIKDASWVCKNGHFSLLKEKKDLYYSCKVMDIAAMKGRLDIVQWLHENHTHTCTVKAMNLAASFGHLDVLKWLFHNRREGCTMEAFECAAKNNHSHVVDWFYTTSIKYDVIKAFKKVCARGLLTMAENLYDKGVLLESVGPCERNSLFFNFDTVTLAIKGNNPDVLSWFETKMCIDAYFLFEYAVTWEALESMDWLYDRIHPLQRKHVKYDYPYRKHAAFWKREKSIQSRTKVLDWFSQKGFKFLDAFCRKAITYDDPVAVEWFCKDFDRGKIRYFIKYAIKKGSLQVLLYLLQKENYSFKVEDTNYLLEISKKNECANFLTQVSLPHNRDTYILALENNLLPLVQKLYTFYQVDSSTLISAIECRSLETLRWLHTHGLIIPSVSLGKPICKARKNAYSTCQCNNEKNQLNYRNCECEFVMWYTDITCVVPCDEFLYKACYRGNLNFIQWYCEKFSFQAESALEHATIGGQVEVIDYFLSRQLITRPMEKIITIAIEGGHLNVVQYLVRKNFLTKSQAYDSALNVKGTSSKFITMMLWLYLQNNEAKHVPGDDVYSTVKAIVNK